MSMGGGADKKNGGSPRSKRAAAVPTDQPGFGGSPLTASKRGRKNSTVVLDAKLILHGEHAEHTVGADVSDILVGLIGDYAFERHIAVLHNDVNRRKGSLGIALQSRIAIDCARRGDPDPVVHWR